MDRPKRPNPIKTLQRATLEALKSNPIARIVYNSYSFFYWFPRKNVAYDIPWTLFKNTTIEWFAYNQIPHNLPPYRYVGYVPADFFCFGLPGNTLPLGDWDPWALSQVSPKVFLELRKAHVELMSSVGCQKVSRIRAEALEAGNASLRRMLHSRTMASTLS